VSDHFFLLLSLRRRRHQGEKDELALLQQSQTSVTDALKRVVERIASQDHLMEQLNTKLTQLSLAEQQLAEKKKSLGQLETPENRQYVFIIPVCGFTFHFALFI